MRFEDLLGDGRLWGTIFDGKEKDALSELFDKWEDLQWLKEFFETNWMDLKAYFKITDVNQAIYDTLDDADELRCLIFDIGPEDRPANLFRHLEDYRTYEMTLGREKTKGRATGISHPSWLRIYAIRLDQDAYLITGGAIKLTYKMEERSHTLEELHKMECVRNFLLENGAHDLDSFIEMNQEDDL